MITKALQDIRSQLPDNVQLIAVSKTKPIEAIQEAYAAGQRRFGENKVQEMVDKYEHLPKDIEWHFIGHLQSNKVKYIAPFVQLIHAVDSLKLLKEINKQANKNERVIDCLLQFHIADEQSKFGMNVKEAIALLTHPTAADMPHIRIVGVMGMATYTDDKEQIAAEFAQLKSIFDTLKAQCFAQDNAFKHISMGMSGDYAIAIEQGSTMVRLGSTLFGDRDYANV